MISPIEVKKHEFARAMRGYDTVEVRAFLETVAAEIERLGETVRSQSGEIERLRAELGAFQRMEQNMREAIVNAQDALRDAKEGARKEAELIRRDAELDAERIIIDARRRGEEIRKELDALAWKKDALVIKLKKFLETELDLFKLLEEEPPSQRMIQDGNANAE